MIPNCLKLEQRQIDLLKKWLAKVKSENAKRFKSACEEDCSCASPVSFEIFWTGIGDNIVAKCLDKKINLSITDDNELLFMTFEDYKEERQALGI